MKIYTITNSSINNYGAILQAFALQKKLTMSGCDSYVLRKIDPPISRLEKLKKFIKPQAHYSFQDRLHIRQSRKLYAHKIKKLNAFYHGNIKSFVCHSLEEASVLVSGADAMVAGSDQIWSPSAHMLSEFTTLQFGPKYIKRFSYAASVGSKSYDEDSELIMREGLKDFSGISVRESSTVNLIKNLTDQDVQQHIDPTLLFDQSFWNNYTSERIITQPYILVYMLRPEPLTLALAQKLSDITGKPLYVISNRIIEKARNITDAGIEDWLSYIKYADYVITNSFHGTAFSVIFKKQFLSVAVEGSGIRVSDFLSSISLSERIAGSVEDINKINETIDWQSADCLLETARQRANDYISKIITPEKTADEREVILYRAKGECCGCGACASICPRKAISLKEDENGFVYPQIDHEKCVKCHLCKKVCLYQNGLPNAEMLRAYAAVCTENGLLDRSASGGVFAAIAKEFLNGGGVVFGCAYVEENGGLHPKHIEVDNVHDLVKLQSSKYAQSNLGETFLRVRNYLKEGRRVLYSGTSCQIAGLRGYLSNLQCEKLFTIDIICHGVPSDKIFQSYLKMIENKKQIKICDINFRDKKFGWGEKGSIGYYPLNKRNNKKTPSFERKAIKIDPLTSSYYKLYLIGAFYRENCYTCPFTDWKKRPGDITIGDYWGIKNQHPEYLKTNGGDWDEKRGVSCILINSKKGSDIVERWGRNLDLKDTIFEKISFRNKLLTRPAFYFEHRSDLLNTFQTEGYDGIDQWFWKTYGLKLSMKNAYHQLPEGFRTSVRNIIGKTKR